MERKNVVMDEKGRLKNLREDLPKEHRFISQNVTIKKAHLVSDGPNLKFKIEFHEKVIPIEIYIMSDCRIIREIFSMMEVKFQEELEGKSLVSYSGINGVVWAIGLSSKNWVINFYEKFLPHTEEEMVIYHLAELPDEKEWKEFCEKQKKKSQE